MPGRERARASQRAAERTAGEPVPEHVARPPHGVLIGASAFSGTGTRPHAIASPAQLRAAVIVAHDSRPGPTLRGVPTPKSFLLLHHIAKSRNLAALLRSADAFGVHEVVVVGRRQLPTGPSVGMGKFVRRAWFQRLGEARDYLRERGCRILGSEVDAAAPPIEAHPFVGDTAFVVGNEGDGLTLAQRAICDGIVRIRQYGHAPSLNVNVAGAIVLHHFALWAGFAERPIEGEKFVPAAFEPRE